MDTITIIPPYNLQQFADTIANLYRCFNTPTKSARLAWRERISFFSQSFLGVPYLNGALGEGPQGLFDQNPLYRTDAFDCVTYVNTVLALALSNNLQEFEKNLLRINYYDSQPLYQKRFHFQCVDWNLQNQAWGIIQEITSKIVDVDKRPIAVTAATAIERPHWFSKKKLADIKQLKPLTNEQSALLLAELRALSKDMQTANSRVPYLPLTRLFKYGKPEIFIFHQIPDIAIIEIVRPNWDLRESISTHLNISHLGFVFWRNGELIFRHATVTKREVVEEPLIAYLYRFLDSETVGGISVLKTRFMRNSSAP